MKEGLGLQVQGMGASLGFSLLTAGVQASGGRGSVGAFLKHPYCTDKKQACRETVCCPTLRGKGSEDDSFFLAVSHRR